jgi:hypothetical protein
MQTRTEPHIGYNCQGHFIQRAHWARAQGPLSQGDPQAVDDHVFFYRIMFHYEIMPASACVIVNYQS